MYKRQHFNTAVAAMMELANELLHASGTSRAEGVRTLLHLLAPFAPHVTEELWHRLGGEGSIHERAWPVFDAAVAATREVTLVVQVNGKVRDRLTVPTGTTEETAREAALASERVRQAIGGATVGSVIFVADRLVNVVTAR